MKNNEYSVIRKKHGKGWTYRYSSSNKTLTNQKIKKWINSLAIPPAWKNVVINLNKNEKIHATGRDGNFKKQYIYNSKWRGKREQEKFDRIIKFANKLSTMRRVTGQHLRSNQINKNRVLAAMVRMIDEAYFRVGSQKYAKKNSTYGLTTLRSKHLTFEKEKLIIEYQGKSKQQQKRVIEDETLIELVKKVDQIPGYEVFSYYDKSGKKHSVDREMLNDYIRDIIGEDFTAKDFRTWGGTFLAAKLLDEVGIETVKSKAKKKILRVIDKVAELLGNTRNIAKSSYIDPRVIKSYENGKTISIFIKEIRNKIKSEDLTSPEERAVMSLLNSVN